VKLLFQTGVNAWLAAKTLGYAVLNALRTPLASQTRSILVGKDDVNRRSGGTSSGVSVF